MKAGDVIRNERGGRIIMQQFLDHDDLFVVSHSIEEVEPTMLMSVGQMALMGYEVGEL